MSDTSTPVAMRLAESEQYPYLRELLFSTEKITPTWSFDEQQADPVHSNYTTEAVKKEIEQLLSRNDLIDTQAVEIKRLQKVEHRAYAMLPLFQDARDAITALSVTQCKLHHISPDLADRMDDVGIKERWEAHEAAQSTAQEPQSANN